MADTWIAFPTWGHFGEQALRWSEHPTVLPSSSSSVVASSSSSTLDRLFLPIFAHVCPQKRGSPLLFCNLLKVVICELNVSSKGYCSTALNCSHVFDSISGSIYVSLLLSRLHLNSTFSCLFFVSAAVYWPHLKNDSLEKGSFDDVMTMHAIFIFEITMQSHGF